VNFSTTMAAARIERTKIFSSYYVRNKLSASASDEEEDRHARYFNMLLFGALSARTAGLDSLRMMVAMFCVNSLELLDRPIKNKDKIVDWIYSRQCPEGGFDGGSDVANFPVEAHLSMTYSALTALLTLGDDLSRLDKSKLSKWMKQLQCEDGSFRAIKIGSEADTRFIFSAAATCFIIGDWSGFDSDKATALIMECFNPADGGFGLMPHQESHGGATYTAVAALSLIGKLELLTEEQKLSIIRFCVLRQVAGRGGFNGRVNKSADTCYAFWVGATLHILGYDEFIDRNSLSAFLDTTSHPMIGGYSKTPMETPDPLHSYFGICGRIICKNYSRAILKTDLGVSMKVYKAYFPHQETHV